MTKTPRAARAERGAPAHQMAAGRRARRRDRTQRELLLAGRALFSEKGLYESRVEEITEKADIGKGTLYRYFRSKEDLIRAVVESGFGDLRGRVDEATTGSSGLRETIVSIARAHFEFFAENPDMVKVLHQVRGMLKFDRPEWIPLRRSLESHVAVLASALSRARGAEILPPARRRELALTIYGSISGTLSVQMALNPLADAESAAAGLVPVLGRLASALAGATHVPRHPRTSKPKPPAGKRLRRRRGAK